jgi:cell division protein FtsA
MANQTKIYVGLEIGSSKTCFVVGEVKKGSAIKILGISVTGTAGVIEGEIFDLAQACECLTDSLAKAEDACDVEIGSVFLAVTGGHIRGINSRGTYQLQDGEPKVTHEHVEEVCRIAREVDIPDDHVYLHPFIRNYRVNGLEQSNAPVGLVGETVEADYHIIHGIGDRIRSSINLVREVGLELDDIVFSSIAAAQIAHARDRERGALIIDIGGGTTDYALYLNGVIAASGCIPRGGAHVTKDIHLATGLPFSKAERLKVIEGDASGDPENSLGTAQLAHKTGDQKFEVSRSILNDVIRKRLEEILQLVRAGLPAGALESMGAGVFVTGGTSQMQGFGEFAAGVFGRDVHRLSPPKFRGIQTNFLDPRYATAMGLIRYAQILETEQAQC